MRSRLEARVAAHLDLVGAVPWVYEPRAFANERGQYLPDFYLPPTDDFADPIYIEVRPNRDGADVAKGQMEIILDSEPGAWLSVIDAEDSRMFLRPPWSSAWSESEWEWAN